jgi:hypothetical protein
MFFPFYFSLHRFGCFVQWDMFEWVPKQRKKFGLVGSQTSDSTILFKSTLWIYLTHPPLPPNLFSLLFNEHNLVILSNGACCIDFLNKNRKKSKVRPGFKLWTCNFFLFFSLFFLLFFLSFLSKKQFGPTRSLCKLAFPLTAVIFIWDVQFFILFQQ